MRLELENLQQVTKMTVLRLEQLEMALTNFLDVNAEVHERILREVCDPFVNRPRVGNTPVRKPVILSPKESIQTLQKITSEVDWAACELLLRGTSLGRIQRILDRVQRSDANILTRSLIVLNLYFEERLLGQYEMEPLIVEHMADWMGAAPINLLENEHTKGFVERLAKPIYDTLKLRTLNRCRHRAYIENVLLNDWVVVQ